MKHAQSQHRACSIDYDSAARCSMPSVPPCMQYDDWVALYVPADANVSLTAPAKFKYAVEAPGNSHMLSGSGALRCTGCWTHAQRQRENKVHGLLDTCSAAVGNSRDLTRVSGQVDFRTFRTESPLTAMALD